MESLITLAFALLAALGDPDQPYARSARPAQHHDTSMRLDFGLPLFYGFKGSLGADACRYGVHGPALLRYDTLADRWLLTRTATSNGLQYECAAVSAPPDIGGPYHRYVFATLLANGAPSLAGPPLVAIWPDAYYISRVVGGTHAQVCGLDRTAMLAGATAEGRCVDIAQSSVRLMPTEMTGESTMLWRFNFTLHTLSGPWPALRTCGLR